MRVPSNAESIDAYITDLKNKTKDCEFEDFTESLIIDRVVCDIKKDHTGGRHMREEVKDLKQDKR